MWCVRFTESQLETLKDLIRIQGEVGTDLEGALEALELARVLSRGHPHADEREDEAIRAQ